MLNQFGNRNRRCFQYAGIGLALAIVSSTGSVVRADQSSERASTARVEDKTKETRKESGLVASRQDTNRLSIERIFASSEFAARRPSLQWADRAATYESWKTLDDKDSFASWVQVQLPEKEEQVLISPTELIPPGESLPLRVESVTMSPNERFALLFTNSKRVWRQNTRGDFWVLDRKEKRLKKLGGDAPESTLQFAKFSPNNDAVAYVRQNNLYLENLGSGEIIPLTKNGGDEFINGTSDWVNEEELDLRDCFRFSPDGTKIAFWQFDTTNVPEFVLINNTDELYPTLKRFKYPKVGQTNSAVYVSVVDLASKTIEQVPLEGDPRQHYVARMHWVPNSNLLLVQQFNRWQNENRVLEYDAIEKGLRTVFVEKDEAWIDVHDDLVWLNDGKEFTWISERDGWRQLWIIDRATGEARCVTTGKYDVIEVLKIDPESGSVYFIASPDHPTQRYLYMIGLDGNDLTRVTPEDQPGTHTYDIDSSGQWAVHNWSQFEMPPLTEVVRLPTHESVSTLETNDQVKARLASLPTCKSEFFRVGVAEGVELDAWCIRPAKFDPQKKYPLLVYVYGEPYGTTVTDSWGGSGYLWHRMLAEQGYVVMSFDNRGTRVPRGREWRKSIYQQIGILAPEDQAKAVEAVCERFPWIDAERVGIWGWSGGGSMSLNAIFKYPKLYSTAISVAPVPDQRYYDTIYQERYMRTPDENPEGFEIGSPINSAGNLVGDLMIIHGTGDDNCHYQTVEKLVNELIRLDKQFTLMAYPNRSHSIYEGPNTTPHMRRLMTDYLNEHLPAGGR